MLQNKTALIYDFLQVNGGAEAVTLDLFNHFNNLDLIISWKNEQCFSKLELDVKRSHVLSSATNITGWQTIKSALSFRYKCPDLSDYSTVIYSGSNGPLAALKSTAKNNVYYCHTPPRFVYDLKNYYLESVPSWQLPLLKTLTEWYQPQYESAVEKMDVILCNSYNVKRRLKEFLNVEAEVIHPPVDNERFTYIADGDYYLSTARLEPYKRIEIIVKAFIDMPDKRLVVASGGSQEPYLRKLAEGADNITFTGWIDSDQLVKLVGNCLATIYIPQDEDFGMSPVESMGAGKPVIGVAEGGVLETVIPEVTGWLAPAHPCKQDIIDIVSSVSIAGTHKMKYDCIQQASKFSKQRFLQSMARFIDGT